jgi:hypothetical protein
MRRIFVFAFWALLLALLIAIFGIVMNGVEKPPWPPSGL